MKHDSVRKSELCDEAFLRILPLLKAHCCHTIILHPLGKTGSSQKIVDFPTSLISAPSPAPPAPWRPFTAAACSSLDCPVLFKRAHSREELVHALDLAAILGALDYSPWSAPVEAGHWNAHG